ncbi:MAG: FMN reductase [Nocardioidaceae bacterium]|nr:FMN reductase [Nocardioidaceae bacterium]
MTSRKLVTISAGLSQPSSTRLLADQLTAAAKRMLGNQRVEAVVDIIELRDQAHDVTNKLVTGLGSPRLNETIDSVARADGLIVVSPIFNASYSGLFKSFFDVLEADSLAGKPVLIAATGGTARHSLALEHALRPMFAYLRAVVVPTAVFAAAEDWGSEGSGGLSLAKRIDRAAGELAALMHAHTFDGPADPFDGPTPFEQLLAGR